uniref:AAA+ ATPase domain-containing protein n=1 Tax=Rhodosorus marinus TaxID=101924 RepID=A0A7S3EE36_9RHOD
MAFLISVSGGSARSTVLRTSTKPNGIEGARGVSRASVKMSAETGEASFGFDKVRGRMMNLVESKVAETRASAQAWASEHGNVLSSENAKVATMALLSAMVFSCAPVAPVLAAETAVSPPSVQQSLQVADRETSASAKTQLADNGQQKNGPQRWRYSQFIDAVEKDQVEKVTFSADGQRLLAVDVDGNRFRLDALPNDPNLLKTLTEHKVDVTVLPQQEENGAVSFLQSLIFPAILFGGIFLLSRGQGGGGGMPGPGGMNPMEMGRSKAKFQLTPETGVQFADVAGCDGAKLELQEVVSFLKEPDTFSELGAKIPRGVILEGPPGTGKTLLARAVAGEAGVPFFSISGSEFVEMFIGVGASRVRDLFGQAKKNAPCIIFIDEIDAVGRQRGAGIAGGNDEREQTLNQILVEMDGFEGNNGVIVIAATNRADILDQALLRPGRFDRRINVELPDFKGRVNILKVHCRGKPLGPDVDIEMIARRTPGFSGASLQNMMNEAAIYTARREKDEISMQEIDDAIERVTLGLERKSQAMSEENKELVAYHEAGHAIVGAMTPDYDQVAKITIIPRGGAGGVTFFAPNEDRVDSGLYSKQFLESQLAVALGGRLAEEIVYGEGDVTNGASNDLQQVSRIARQMITQFGFSEEIGQMALDDSDPGNPFLGRQMAQGGVPMSMNLRAQVDDEVRRLVKNAYQRARTVLLENRDLLDATAKQLVENETMSAEEFQRLVATYEKVEMMPYSPL